ncbi:MAG TPA: glycoside hydrolase family 43 protein [Vicinamibacterales bacterium]|nr:glycoside hydrolase family 43 protein [Vicinamibacterales bacterium]HPW22262.1 glycoside hydrolase family 43 protein [Vicinamibacterales bacterium]
MKRPGCFASISLAAVLLGCGQGQPELTLSNPLPVELGDPYVLKASDGRYYMVGTGGVRDGFKMYSSADLRDWKDEGRVFQGNSDTSWCVASFWAPELYEHQGRFYLFYSADWRENPANELENFRIGVAVSDRPTGLYTDLYNRPIFDPGYPILDANLLLEGDRVFLYYSRACYKHPVETELAAWARRQGLFDEIEESWIYGVELKPDFSGVIGEPQLLLRPPAAMDDRQAEWESRSVTSGEVNRRWTEGSFIFKHRGVYYLMYSANFYGGQHYAVGYATSGSPLGPFVKAANNPVLQQNVQQGGIVTGTGHNCVTQSPNGKQMLCVYHGYTSRTGKNRVVFIDRMDILEGGRLVVHGPTMSPSGAGLAPGGRAADR